MRDSSNRIGTTPHTNTTATATTLHQTIISSPASSSQSKFSIVARPVTCRSSLDTFPPSTSNYNLGLISVEGRMSVTVVSKFLKESVQLKTALDCHWYYKVHPKRCTDIISKLTGSLGITMQQNSLISTKIARPTEESDLRRRLDATLGLPTLSPGDVGEI